MSETKTHPTHPTVAFPTATFRTDNKTVYLPPALISQSDVLEIVADLARIPDAQMPAGVNPFSPSR
jgi:hypothetical protein